MTGGEPVPAMVAHYAAAFRARSGTIPEVTLESGRYALTIRKDGRALTLAFACRKHRWRLHRIELARDGETISFALDELAKAVALLLGRESPPVTGPGAVTGTSGPRTDAALRSQRATVIRV